MDFHKFTLRILSHRLSDSFRGAEILPSYLSTWIVDPAQILIAA